MLRSHKYRIYVFQARRAGENKKERQMRDGARVYVLSVVKIAEIEGEKKYSPPRDCTKSVTRVIDLFAFVGSRLCTKRGCPAFAPIMGSNPGVGSVLSKKNLGEWVKDK